MSDFIVNFLEEVVILPIITFVIGILFNVFKRYGSRARRRKLTRLKIGSEDDDIICFTANSGHYDESELVTLGYVFEYIAIGELRVSLKELFKGVEVSARMSPEDFGAIKPRDLRSDLILIGGPFHNSVTRKIIFGNDAFPFHFEEDAGLVYEGEEGREVYTPEESESNRRFYEKDYALIVNVRNPYAPKKKRVIALMGCRSIGCLAAGVFLSTKLKKFHRTVKDDEYAIVVKCEGDEEDIIDEPEFVKYYELDFTPPELIEENK